MNSKTKILFICLGNICRSPLAEFVFKKMIADQAAADQFVVASAATSGEEVGNPVYAPVRKLLAERGIDCSDKHAVQVRAADYDRYDYLIVMEDANVRALRNIVNGDPDGKIWKLLDFVDGGTPLCGRNISDPWYTRDFQQAYNDIEEGCAALLLSLSPSLRL